ncbi:response regulator transcription factor [Salmonella enterica]|uniref:winged helix-turn-helix domain-containing protein n=1 Tax=Salmonella enterica TaxID=28901 RepID=UPI00111BAC50|nr:response regulator transcription factor [Salmonella enterica]EBD0851655.1 response regulator transcription factor [Salmonella enterica]EBF2435108.1 response regulator transcription factor [Salmonella enterica]ECE2168171.1 response regulator transcription factor [Salmonella enterica]ECV6476204.1 response regulator transcription factor [Salmonella enterica]EDR5750686.1 response regulator transcription factor [Salmonella enterica subsp. enterica serovar Cubana]
MTTKARLFHFYNNFRADAGMRILFIRTTEFPERNWQQTFNLAGHNVDSFTDLPRGERALGLIPYCAVIIEMSPQDTGVIQMLSRWRSKGVKTPVMILSHERLTARRVAVLHAGADDCMEAPPDPEELMARIRAIVRRGHSITSSRLYCGNIVFDTATREVRVGKKNVGLTARETTLLEIFMMNERRTLSKTFLVEKMYSWQNDISSNVVEVFVSGLRKKLGKQVIRTVSGLGYMFTGNSEKEGV